MHRLCVLLRPGCSVCAAAGEGRVVEAATSAKEDELTQKVRATCLRLHYPLTFFASIWLLSGAEPPRQ